MTRQEQALWFINFVRIVAVGTAALAVAAVIYYGLRNFLPGKEDKLSRKQMRRQARKAAKANSNLLQGRKRPK
jgi:hypothetical protein